MLNIGCGSVFHPLWINIDISPVSSHVIQCDIESGLPFENNFFDVCYSSHLLEHISLSRASAFMKEIFRVLKPEGIVRIVVPDLEGIVSMYLKLLEKIRSGNCHAENDYDWIMLELYDQTVRTFSGGYMKKYLEKREIQNKDFILSRIGFEAESFFLNNNMNKVDNESAKSPVSLIKKIGTIVKRGRYLLTKLTVYVLSGKKMMKSFEEGYFRNSGETHKWMYDDYSLARLLQVTGFEHVVKCSADESRIPRFHEYNLDTFHGNGKVRKPDSLYMEAIKPSNHE